jgi:hypothetical protein
MQALGASAAGLARLLSILFRAWQYRVQHRCRRSNTFLFWQCQWARSITWDQDNHVAQHSAPEGQHLAVHMVDDAI